MSTPAPHTPVNFLKAGGASFFSAACQKALQDLGWDPEEFGDYDHTLNYMQQCRARVAAGDPSLTARQRELGAPYYNADGTVNPSAYSSGHMYFNSTMQSERGEDCTNRVDGYSMGGCPAMPHQGQTSDAGTQHNRHTVREYAGALGPNGQHNPGGLYGGAATPADAMAKARADARARARAIVQEREEELRQRGGEPQASGTDAAPAAPAQPGAAGEAGKAAPGSVGAGAGGGGEVTGDTAADCLESFVDRGFDAMQAQCQQDVADNQAAAGGVAPPTPQQVESAKRAATQARRDVRSAERKHGEASPEAAAARDRAASAEAEHSRVTSPQAEAACRAAQGQRLAQGTDRAAPGQPGNRGAGVPGTAASRRRRSRGASSD